MEFTYPMRYKGHEDVYKSDCEKAIKILREAGFDEEVLQREIEDSKRDWGDEFFSKVAMDPSIVSDWKRRVGFNTKYDSECLVLRCLDFG